MILLHPCPTCPNGLTEHRNTSCVRCKAAFEAEFNPNDRPVVTSVRLTWWQRWLIRRRWDRAVRDIRRETP